MRFANNVNQFVTWERGILRCVTTVRCKSVKLVKGKRVERVRTYVDSIDSVSRATRIMLDDAGILADLEHRYRSAHIDWHLPSNTITVQAVRNDGEHCVWWTTLEGEKHWTKLPRKRPDVPFSYFSPRP